MIRYTEDRTEPLFAKAAYYKMVIFKAFNTLNINAGLRDRNNKKQRETERQRKTMRDKEKL